MIKPAELDTADGLESFAPMMLSRRPMTEQSAKVESRAARSMP